MKTQNNDYILIVVNAIVFFLVLFINLIVRSFSYLKIVDVDGIQHLQAVKSYYEYFDELTILSLVAITSMLLISMIIVHRKQKIAFKRTIEFSNLFLSEDFQYIDVNKATTTEEKLIINSWNRSVKQIIDLEERRDEYFNMMVHDLKMPIQLVKFNTELFNLEYGENIYMKKIDTQIGKLQGEIERILILEKIKYFENPNFETVDLIKLVKNTTLILSENTMVQFDSNYDKLNIKTDEAMLKKILSNIADNILKYNDGQVVRIVMVDNKLTFTNSTNSKQEYTHDYQIEREYSSTGNGLGTQIISTYAQKINLKIKVSLKKCIYRTELDFNNQIDNH